MCTHLLLLTLCLIVKVLVHSLAPVDSLRVKVLVFALVPVDTQS